MPDPNGFLRYDRQCRRAARCRADQDWREVYPPAGDELIREQAARCMDCGIPFCHDGCPLGNLIPDWNDLVRTGNWDAARRVGCTPPTTSPSSPAGSARRPARRPACSASATRPGDHQAGRGGDRRPRGGRRLADPAAGAGADRPVGRRGRFRPAGLAAAQQLARAGHAVTVYERDDAIGGLLRYGIPDFKLEKQHIDRRMAQLAAEGVEFRDRLRDRRRRDRRGVARRHDAVLLACGALQGRDTPRRPAGRCAAYTWRWTTWSPPTGSQVAGRVPRHADRRRRQARGHHRRWRHRRRLSRRGPPAGRGGVHQLDLYPQPPHAGTPTRPVADLAVGAAQLPGARGGRRPGLRGGRAGVRGRRHRPGQGRSGSPR